MAEGPIQAYQRVANSMGHDLKLGEGLTIGVSFYLAKTREQAIREMLPYYEEHVKMFAPLASAGSHEKRPEKRLARLSIPQNPGSATTRPTARRGFCPGDRMTSPVPARSHLYAPRLSSSAISRERGTAGLPTAVPTSSLIARRSPLRFPPHSMRLLSG
jgi:hypothetical protein